MIQSNRNTEKCFYENNEYKCNIYLIIHCLKMQVLNYYILHLLHIGTLFSVTEIHILKEEA